MDLVGIGLAAGGILAIAMPWVVPVEDWRPWAVSGLCALILGLVFIFI